MSSPEKKKKFPVGIVETLWDLNLELAYLRPNYFSPDLSVLELQGVKKGEKYAILRFVKWNANHDLGHTGIAPENKIKAVQEFAKHARVFISSESELPAELESFKIKIPPEKMHDALAFSALLYGESATMASECAVLGTPAIYLDDFGRGYTNEEEQKYGLVFNFTESQEDQGLSIEKGIELLTTPGLKQVWQRRRQKLLNDKIDVTNFMVWFVENYPDSVRIMQANPDFRSNFNAANGAPQVLRHHPGSLPSKTEATYPEY